MPGMSFANAVELARGIIRRFEKIEGKPWQAEGSALELTKQVGELAKLLMVQEGYYFQDRDKIDPKYRATKDQIADELADILYAVIRIADHYGIDLEEAHIKAREGEDEFLKTRGV